jgi:hypothetical protein
MVAEPDVSGRAGPRPDTEHRAAVPPGQRRGREVVLFHSVLGVRPGIRQWAERFCAAGYRVHVPDLYDGAVFDSIPAGMQYLERLGGIPALIARSRAAVAHLPPDVVYAGFSNGAAIAELFAATRAGARGGDPRARRAPRGRARGDRMARIRPGPSALHDRRPLPEPGARGRVRCRRPPGRSGPGAVRLSRNRASLRGPRSPRLRSGRRSAPLRTRARRPRAHGRRSDRQWLRPNTSTDT